MIEKGGKFDFKFISLTTAVVLQSFLRNLVLKKVNSSSNMNLKKTSTHPLAKTLPPGGEGLT